MEEPTQSDLRTDSNEVVNDFQKQNVNIQKVVVSDDEPTDLQPISQVYFQEIHIKFKVVSTELPVKQLQDKHEHTKTFFSCSLCKRERMGLKYFKSHLINIHHLKSEESSKYIPEFYQCKYCQRQFKAPSLLHIHEGSHTFPFKCDICGKRYTRRSYLKSHKLTHSAPHSVKQLEDKHEHTKTFFSCSLCKREKMELLFFKAHMNKIHHLNSEEISKYITEFCQCKYCHRRFKTPSLLARHEGSHTLPFKCDICYKIFGSKSILKQHKLTHSEPQFPCPSCDKKFRRKNHLQYHIDRLHSGLVHKCDQCENIFKCRSYLMDHIKFIHNKTNQSSWNCNECGRGFRNKHNLRRHIIYVHLILSKNYICSYCSLKVETSDNLKHHIKRKHNSVVPIESSDCSRKLRNRPKTFNDPISEPLGQILELKNQHTKEDDGPEIQPISEGNLPDYQEENIKTEVTSPLEPTMTDEVETIYKNDVQIKSEITIDEMECSMLKESTEITHSEGQCVSSQIETSAYTKDQGATQDNMKELSIVLDSNEVKKYLQTQNVKIKEEVVSDLQPISQVYLPKYEEENIKTDVDSTSLADTAENDVEIETEITIDEMDRSTLKIEENTEEAHSERQSSNLVLDCINKNEILTKKQKQDEVETTDENNVKIKSEFTIDEMDCSTFKIEESTL